MGLFMYFNSWTIQARRVGYQEHLIDTGKQQTDAAAPNTAYRDAYPSHYYDVTSAGHLQCGDCG